MNEHELAPDLICIRNPVDQNTIEFQIKNSSYYSVDIILDLSGSQNVNVEDIEGMKIQKIIQPKTQEKLATITHGDQWDLKTRFGFNYQEIAHGKRTKKLTKQRNEEIDDTALLESRKRLGKNSLYRKSATQICELMGSENYTDPFFPPNIYSITGHIEEFDRRMEWRRPKEFFKGDFLLFKDGIEPDDLLQGELGDCWFMSALAALAERPQLVQRLFVTKEVNEQGMYNVKFCKMGKWQVVTVDDYFPCFFEGQPMFSRSHDNELWALLLQKAYAKYHGSYLSIRAGYCFEAMMDLTGCPTLYYNFEQPETKALLEEGLLWPKLVKYDEEGSLICGSTPGEDQWTEQGGPDVSGGLVPGHSYSFIQVKEAHGNRLVNIRNPWGEFEWDGDWSDHSPLWTEEMKAALDPVLDDEDGTFWMSYYDFLKYFKSISVCRLCNYFESRCKGMFMWKEVLGSKRVVSRWYYGLHVTAETVVNIGVHQEDNRVIGAKQRRPYMDIGLVVLKVHENGHLSIFQVCKNKLERQVEMEVTLPIGHFIVIPRTSGCMLSSKPNFGDKTKLLDSNKEMTMIFRETVNDLFRKFDVTLDGSIDYEELKGLYKEVGVNLEEDEFQVYMDEYASTEDGLTKQGFEQLIRDQTLKDKKRMWDWLDIWGYDKDLFAYKRRQFNFTLHTRPNADNSKTVSLELRDALQNYINYHVMNLLMEENGTIKDPKSKLQMVFYHEPDAGCYNYGFYNNTPRHQRVTFDCTNSQGMLFSGGVPSVTWDIKPRCYEYMLTALVDPNYQGAQRILPRIKNSFI